ncbi:MAG TPA: adenine phosphoribosyltransferase [Bacteriovoracaceae bacterium]|nr:adenine phosphoribosyltransferase [Bacteriovoracaceae bacterium]
MHSFESHIRSVPDFPKAGVIFKDITPLLQERFSEVISSMSQGINWDEIDFVVGIESRGFILGAAMAQLKGKGFIPMRKKGKLPPPVIGESYSLEYGTDTLEMIVNEKAGRVVLVDDVLATGGTLRAAMNLCRKNKLEVRSMALLINLTFLNKFTQEGLPVISVLNY